MYQEGQVVESGLWAGFQVISTYSRAQALKDDVLVDVSKTAREAGFLYPVAVTAAVWERINYIPGAHSGQSVHGRLWDVLCMGRFAAMQATRQTKADGHPRDEILYKLILQYHRKKLQVLKLVVGLGDTGWPVITIMLPNED